MLARIRSLPIRKKLRAIIMMITMSALVLASAAFMGYEIVAFRNAVRQGLSTTATIIGYNVTAALLFNDPESATATLSGLRADSRVLDAHVYGADNHLFASFVAVSSVGAAPGAVDTLGEIRTANNAMSIFQAIEDHGERVGTVYLRMSLQELSDRLRKYLLIVLSIMLAALLAAFFLSSSLERILTEPILSLVETSQRVSAQKDFSIRAIRYNDDELGYLVDAFNSMLSQIEERDRNLMATVDQLGTAKRDLEHQMMERERKDAALRESEVRFRSLVQSARSAIVVCDAEGRIMDWNHAASSAFGYSTDEIIGSSVDQILPDSGPACRLADRDWIQAARQDPGSNAQLERVARHRTGRLFPVEVSVATWKAGGHPSYSMIIQDITERKVAEDRLKTYAGRLEHSNRELQDFAYVSSHDLQEPLRKIQAFGERLQTKYAAALGPEGKDYLERMTNAAQRMQSLILDLLAYSRVSTKVQPFARVDLNQIVREVMSDLEVRIEQTAAIIRVEPLPSIDADPMQMRQLFQNLLGNALKFRQKDRPPEISVKAVDLSDGSVSTWELIVSDNGIGFDQKYSDRIFGVFQRLHGRNEYEGSGVGLAICRKIAERHGGRIVAEGRPNEGATFRITLVSHAAGTISAK